MKSTQLKITQVPIPFHQMKKKFLLFLFLGLFAEIDAQEINWISFEEAISQNKKTPKQFLIDVYTDWCGYCKKMDRNTYAFAPIASYINENFYAVKLNAEQKQEIHYLENTFRFVAQGRRGYHEFASALLQGKMSYPSTVFLSKEETLLTTIPGYLNTTLMEQLLVYFGEYKYENQEWTAFQKEYKSNW